MNLTSEEKKALDKALAEMDRWKEATSLEMAKLSPTERAARDKAASEWLRSELERVRKAKKRRKPTAKRMVRARAR